MNLSEIAKKAEKLLANANLRQTQPRLAVIQALIKSQHPISQEQIADNLSDSAPNKVTIYRILESFMEKGLVHKAFTKNRTNFYELAHNCTHQQCHPHFTCTNCHETLCIKNATIPLARIADKGFTIQHQKVELEGLCPKCS